MTTSNQHAAPPPESPAQQLDRTWREMQGKLRRRARLLCKGDIYRADELLSDTALKVHIYLQRSPERVQNLAGFLFLALNHAFLDGARRRLRESGRLEFDPDWDDDHTVELAGHAPSMEQQLLLRQLLLRLEQALSTLPPQQQMLFTLKFEEDRPYLNIAATLGINEPLARKRVELLRKKLREELA
ncbi:sigma-70 family RNA polymerase sigma factor [Burkholderia pyrrocinia]|uniref:RNA polymerase sigma factor n=1 Tax=Burkholderia pyrrocinia TaxID=60550 RepID=UPI00050125A7|nr:sigma-70 family RNA polymerase sigma factor [Burkholderia pyrrocinia]KFL49942.1 RNA polymerase sigma24 factor [Burkholderia pyrrocinia]UOB60105.1 sigma-70 family RNA polymerase sigma factor [Burkholderia pyrrocinia]